MGRSRSRSYSDDDRRGSSEERNDRRRRDRDDDDRRRDRDDDDRRRDRDDDDRRRDRKRSHSRSPSRRHKTSRYRSRSRSSSPSYRSSSRRHESSSRRHKEKTTKNVIFGTPPISQADFDNWMQLLNAADAKNDVTYAREKYTEFLTKYPFCYGFWQKFADFERRNNNMTECLKVWQKSIIAIPLSIDLWIGFISFMRETAGSNHEDQIRVLYERGLGLAGLEFNSDRLWLDTIGWEQAIFMKKYCTGAPGANAHHVSSVFDRLLATPTMHSGTHLSRYVLYLNNVDPDILLPTEEYEEIFKIVKAKFGDKQVDQLMKYEEVKIYSKCPDGVNYILLDENEEGAQEATITKCQYDESFLKAMREEIVRRRTNIHDQTQLMIAERKHFEMQINRPYFHVKPLEHQQLVNWLAYLDFEIKKEDELRAECLFERCIITCALYEEFWIKYAHYVWKVKESESKVREIYKRASVHVGCSVRLAFARSAFEETRGDFEAAIEILEAFKEKFPGYVAVDLRIGGIMRRKVEHEKSTDYTKVVSFYDRLIHSTSTSKYLASFYAIKLARFHNKVRGDREAAEKVIKRTIEKDHDNLQLYMQLIDMAYSAPELSQTEVCHAFDFALKSDLKMEDKLKISQRKVDFLEDLATDAQMIEDAHDEHLQLIAQTPQQLQLKTRINNGFNKQLIPPVNITPLQPQWPQQQQQQQQPMMQMIPMQQYQQVQMNMSPGINSPSVDGQYAAMA